VLAEHVGGLGPPPEAGLKELPADLLAERMQAPPHGPDGPA
jgi:hypothetical protein